MKKVIFLLLLSPLFFNAQNRSITFETGTWKEVLAKAKKENKLIMMDAFTSWCGPCKWMAKNVFTNDTVADFYNANFVNAKFDMEKGEGIELAKHYGVQAYPTFLFVNGDGQLIHRICGSEMPQDFIKSGKTAMTPALTLSHLEKQFNAAPGNAEAAAAYFAGLAAGCASVEIPVNTYFSKVKAEEFSSRFNWNILYKHVSNSTSPGFVYLVKHQDEFIKKYGADSVSKKIESVYDRSFSIVARSKDKAALDALEKEIRTNMAGDVNRIIWKGQIGYFQVTEDWTNYGSTVVKFVDQYGLGNASLLNQYAWAFYERISDKTLLEHAARWAKKSTELNDAYYNNDTHAAVLFKLGKKAEAKKAAEHAIELGKKGGEDVKETEELLKKIEALQ